MANISFGGIVVRAFLCALAWTATMAINKEVNRIMLMPDIKASLAAQGADLFPANSPGQFKANFAKEVATWMKFFKARPDLVD